MTDKKKLPVVGKSLMPEVLPPPPQRAGVAGPRERVLARLKQISKQTTAMATAAAINACGYAVVDPLPTPAGIGAGGVGGNGGGGRGSGAGAGSGAAAGSGTQAGAS